ncbi:PAS domain-containing protein [Mycoplana rhizolycopersici]|uniref:PAS domain-containing protein n=1 Tax=Mycoplana rhizolycopersici TaxID=2746702 RepID=A0ABX2QJE7_9HYPH|nr:PAS domain-containing protein [Rhizobium rhizolycopersici]NVP56444.1 PAS domain-containing protein [Rhizobium rhizolycopersici]
MADVERNPGENSVASGAMERLTEEFWDRYRRLYDAIADDNLPTVRRLDRELTSALSALIDHQTLDAAEQQAQFTALLKLLREQADDASSVRNNADLIELLLRRYITVRTRPVDQKGLPALSAPVRNGVLDVGQLDTLPERVAVVTTDYRYLYANASDAERLKRKPHELVGRHVREIVGVDSFNGRIKRNLDRCFAGEVVEDTNARETDGKIIVIRRRLTPCYADEKTLIGALVVIHEGPDRRRRDN